MDSAQRFSRVLPGPTRLARARRTSCQTPHTFADDGRALEGQTECIAVLFLLLVCAVKVRVAIPGCRATPSYARVCDPCQRV